MTQVDLDSQLMDDMEPHLLSFLQTTVNSFVKWDLIRFFHDNPHAADTAENIARYIGRDLDLVEQEMIGLAEAGVLQKTHVPGACIFALSPDPAVKAVVNDFLAACADRQFRVKAIYHVIRAMR
jgi:hypothetical protein